jgi:hypothetical protein
MRLQSFLIEQSSKKFKIYCDMDGVLTDFPAAFKKIDGRPTTEVEKEGDDAFWDHVRKGGLEFWSNMPWISGSKKLWNYIKDKDTAILSAPAISLPNSPKGKAIWVKRELGSSAKLILKRARDKKEYASKNSILIDDMKKNISDWKSAGGIGILFKNPNQVIKELEELGV